MRSAKPFTERYAGASSSSCRRGLAQAPPLPQRSGRTHRAAPALPGPQEEGWVQQVEQVATSLLAAAVTASALLCSSAAPPPALAHAGEHASPQASAAVLYGSAASAPPGTAASKFSCRPMTWDERVRWFEPDLRGFGTHKIHTSSPRAQALFDQGLLLSYNFNGPEAQRAFEAGLAEDAAAPMLHWGVVHSLAPYANKVWAQPPADNSFPVMTQLELARAKRAAQEGLAAAAANLAASPDDPLAAAEHAYLSAADRLFGGLDKAGDPGFRDALQHYAEELEAIAAAYSTDADAPALAAAARMNLSPWVHWTGPLTSRTPVEPEAVVLPALRGINTSLERRPGHPLATHLLIHLAESATPGSSKDVPAAFGYAALAEAAADSLAAADLPHQDHLIHMPSHIYLRVGRWHDAVAANTRALDVEEQLAQRCIEPYMPEHNASMLQYAAMMSGELGEARRTAARQADFPRLFGPTNMPDGRERAALPMLLARFGRWPELLALTRADLDYSSDGLAMLPPGTEAYNDGLLHYARLLALASSATHEPDAAARASLLSQVAAEFDGLAAAVAATPPDPLTQPGDGIGIYSPGFKVLGQVEVKVAQARRAVLAADWDAAAAALEAALALDGAVGYTEPPRQYQPLRHCLGWVRLQAGQLDAAEQVYRDDLAELPANPWSLKGLQQVYAARAAGGHDTRQQLAAVDAALQAAWAHADPGLPLPSSCPAFSD